MSPTLALTQSDGVTISCFENEIPQFVETEMNRLYGNIYSSLAHFTYANQLDNVNTYVAQNGCNIIALLLFRCEDKEVRVINEMIQIDGKEIRRFVNTIFSQYSSVTLISLNAIRTSLQRFPFPYQLFHCAEDIVLALPSTSFAYLASLGKNLRKTIQRYMGRLERNFPTYRYDVHVEKEVAEQYIRDIIHLHKMRMDSKNTAPGKNWNEEEMQWLINLVKSCGLVGIVRIDGKVCGGQICCRFGKNYFMLVIAHDSAYDDYRLGTLCCYLTICECISRGGQECHFMEGRSEYKYSLLGKERGFDHLCVYRSWKHVVLNSKTALKNQFNGYIAELKLKRLNNEYKKDFNFSRFIPWVKNGLAKLEKAYQTWFKTG